MPPTTNKWAQPGNCCGVDRPRRAAPPRVCRPRHDAVLPISRSSRPRSLRFCFFRRADFHLVINRALLPGRVSSTDARDNLVSSTVSTLRSAVMRRVVARGQLECVCPWRLAPSQPRQRRELRSPPAVREAWQHHRRCLLTHSSPSVVLKLDPAVSCKRFQMSKIASSAN